MRNNKGITMVALTITVIVMAILSGIIINLGSEHVKNAKLQDIVTNMYLIQAKAKIGIEEVVFKKINLDENKEEDFNKIQEIKTSNLIGEKYLGGISEIDNVLEIEGTEEWYYLTDEHLKLIGLYELTNINDSKQYYLYRYDEDTSNIEIVYTGGYVHTDQNTYYRLSELENIQNS